MAARPGGFGQFGDLLFFFGLNRGVGAAQRESSRPRLVGVDHGLGCRLRARPAAISPHVRGHALLGAAWALRLSLFITWRNWGQPEERRYAQMRERNEPHVDWKSLYLVFGLQALLALVVVMPFLAAAAAPGPATTWSGLQGLGLAVALSNLLSYFVSQRLRYPL